MTFIGRRLFEEVVACTGLASFIGPGTVERALVAVGATPDGATLDDYRRALPELRGRMAVYLKGDDLQRRFERLQQLVRG